MFYELVYRHELNKKRHVESREYKHTKKMQRICPLNSLVKSKMAQDTSVFDSITATIAADVKRLGYREMYTLTSPPYQCIVTANWLFTDCYNIAIYKWTGDDWTEVIGYAAAKSLNDVLNATTREIELYEHRQTLVDDSAPIDVGAGTN